MLKNINTFIFDVLPTLNLAEKITIILGVLVISYGVILATIRAYTIICQWLANPGEEVYIAAYLDCVGWALLLAGVGCWFAGWIAVMAIIFVAGVLFLLAGSSV
ncbi:hypothetical protein PST86_14590 [Yersinia pestis]|nr:hypothetical protein [Yersinia pestis]